MAATNNRMETWGGIALAVSAVLALVFANSGLRELYAGLLSTPVSVAIGEAGLKKPLLLWINDGLMAVFFLLVGLEIKREFAIGELAGWRKAILPIVAAAGGFVLPALIFVALLGDRPDLLKAWAVPTATDIAFVVGLLAALGSRVPVALKVFVLAVAIIDDLFAVIVIAAFYTAQLSGTALAVAAGCVAVLAALNRLRVASYTPYVLVGIVLWLSVLKSGVHATLAGVVLGLLIPIEGRRPEERPLERMEHGLKPWVAFLVVPVFAFANAGVPFLGIPAASLLTPLTIAIALGLFVGKQVGILATVAAVVRSGLAPKPARSTWLQIYGVSVLTGIGFTMSLFIGSLALPDPASQDQIRIGVLTGSLLSGLLGTAILLVAAKKAPSPAG